MRQAQTSKVSAMLTCLTSLQTKSANDACKCVLGNMAFQSTSAVKITAAHSADSKLQLRLEIACCFIAEAFAILTRQAEASCFIITLNGSAQNILGFKIIRNSANLSGQIKEFIVSQFLRAIEA